MDKLNANKLKHFVLAILIYSFALTLHAQDSSSLQNLINQLRLSKGEIACAQADAILADSLSTFLQQHGAYDTELNLQGIGSIRSKDGKLRIISWNYAIGDGRYGYHALLIYRKNKRQKATIRSLVNAIGSKPDEQRKYNANGWYGALYYNIFALQGKYYLLGYATYNGSTKVKMIEVLQFKNERPVFGAPVFYANAKSKKAKQRIVFEYSNKANMALNYDSTGKRFVFDHLSPEEASMKDIYAYYGPDFSIDGYALQKKKWVFIEDLNITNPK